MLPMDIAMQLVKGKRRFEYDILPGKQGGAVARAGLWRRPVVEPMPGMDSSMVLVDGTPMTLQEAEAGGFIYPEDEKRMGLGYTLPGLGLEASLANVHPSDKNPNTFDRDTDFSRDDTIQAFMDEVAPKMAHETGHVLDSQWNEGSLAQAEMPAHVLEVATREAMDRRRGRDPKYSIIEDAASRLKERLYRPGADFPTTIQTPEDNPDYEYDITDDQIISGEPMDLAFRLLKRQTELGEFHEDLPSSHGPVTGYRGLSRGKGRFNLGADEHRRLIGREGLLATQDWTKGGYHGNVMPDVKGHFQRDLERRGEEPFDDHVVYSWLGHDDKGLEWAKAHAKSWARGRPDSFVVPIRGQRFHQQDSKFNEDYRDEDMHSLFSPPNKYWYDAHDEWEGKSGVGAFGPYALPYDIPPELTVRQQPAQGATSPPVKELLSDTGVFDEWGNLV